MSDSDLSKILGDNSVVDFAESHPIALIAVIIVLVLLIVSYIAYTYWPASEKLTAGASSNGKKYLNDDDEIDNLLSSIKEKQKRNLQQAAK